MRTTRRTWLAGALGVAGPRCRAADPGVKREIFVKSPRPGVAVMAFAFYTRPRGTELLSIEEHWSRSDTIDAALRRWSTDHGRSWSKPVEQITGEKRADGMLRRHPRGGFADPKTGRFVEFWVEGVLPSDDPLEGMRQWNIFYSVSEDGGRTNHGVEQVTHRGAEFNARHALPGVHTGRNSVMLGDMTGQPLARPDGAILLPVSIAPLGPDGVAHNPGGGYTYQDSAVLEGRWKGMRLEWTMSEMIVADPARTTRGLSEPTIESLRDGRLIVVLRGSNDRKPALPSHRWVSYSSDGGRRWTKPEPWRCTDGQPFFSPSACSQLLRHSSGGLYWLGNLLQENPRGNRPRYPLVIAAVDGRSGLLVRDSVRIVDDRAAGEDERLTLSNFYAREDRVTRDVVVHMTRLLALPDGWRGDAFLYRISV